MHLCAHTRIHIFDLSHQSLIVCTRPLDSEWSECAHANVHAGRLLEERDEVGRTALHLAAAQGQRLMVQALLSGPTPSRKVR